VTMSTPSHLGFNTASLFNPIQYCGIRPEGSTAAATPSSIDGALPSDARDNPNGFSRDRASSMRISLVGGFEHPKAPFGVRPRQKPGITARFRLDSTAQRLATFTSARHAMMGANESVIHLDCNSVLIAA
jgi:hypothetical protein